MPTVSLLQDSLRVKSNVKIRLGDVVYPSNINRLRCYAVSATARAFFGGELCLIAIPWRVEIFISRYMLGHDEIDHRNGSFYR